MKTQTAYLAVKVEDELPEEGTYSLFALYYLFPDKPTQEVADFKNGKFYYSDLEDIELPGVTHWLKETTVVLPEEVSKIASDAWDAGQQYDWERNNLMYTTAPNKEQYLKTIIE